MGDTGQLLVLGPLLADLENLALFLFAQTPLDAPFLEAVFVLRLTIVMLAPFVLLRQATHDASKSCRSFIISTRSLSLTLSSNQYRKMSSRSRSHLSLKETGATSASGIRKSGCSMISNTVLRGFIVVSASGFGKLRKEEGFGKKECWTSDGGSAD